MTTSRPRKMTPRALCFAAALLAGVFPLSGARAADARPKFEKDLLKLEAGDYEADFVRGAAWTIGTLRYKGKVLICRTGANQTVVNLKTEVQSGKEPWVGSSHGGEIVEEAWLTVDGERYPIEQAGSAPAGKEYRLVKESLLGPFRCRSTVRLDASGLGEEVEIKADGDAALARYLFVFMHCFAPTLHDWLAILPDRNVVEDRFPEERKRSLEKDISALALYSEQEGIGVLLRYDEPYPGQPGESNFLINWPGRHHKHYFRVAAAEVAGKTYRCRLEGFRGSREQWRQWAIQAAPAPQP